MFEKELPSRLKFFLAFIVLIFILFIGRLWQLQIILGQEFERQAEGNRIRLTTITPPRGMIYDRYGRMIASNRKAFTVSMIIPDRNRIPYDIIERLAKITGMDCDEILNKIQTSKARYYQPIRLLVDVDSSTVIKIEEHRMELPGVIIEEIPVRNYIYGDLLGHTIGYIGEIDNTELEELKGKGYSPGDLIGKTGIERSYDIYLKGVPGGRQVEVNSLQRPTRVLGTKAPVPGNSLYLTIDVQLQEMVEKALKEQLEALQKIEKYKNSRAGVAIVMDPNNGEILALASVPGIDSNDFVGGISYDKWVAYRDDSREPLLNRATQGVYPPGSVFKAVTTLAALDLGLVKPDERFYCSGRDPISKKYCWERKGHGSQTLLEGIQNSCNIVFYELGRRLGIDNLSKYAKDLGIGSKTGFELKPEEKEGLMPTKEWKAAAFSRLDQKVWYPNETLDAAIGQGFVEVTPLQIAVLYSAIANGGTFYKPYIVKSVATPFGEQLLENEPEVTHVSMVGRESFEVLKEGLVRVVKSGTARGSFYTFPLDRYPIAGKTGTAQAGAYDHAWFAAFGPADDPEIVVVVMIERGASGSGAAVPVGRRIFDAYFGLRDMTRGNSPSSVDQGY